MEEQDLRGGSRFIECDGVVQGSLLSQIISTGGIFASAKAKEEWVPRKIYYRSSDIGEMMYYPEDRKFVEKVAPRARPFNIAQVIAGLGAAPAVAPHGEEDDPEPQEIITYAPAGWYFCPDWTKTQYHIARDADAEALARSSADSDIARAIKQLADEIALKPSAVPGSEFLAAQERFESGHAAPP